MVPVSDPSGSIPPLPLQGIRVVEIGQNIAGPHASAILASLGADSDDLADFGHVLLQSQVAYRTGGTQQLRRHLLPRRKFLGRHRLWCSG